MQLASAGPISKQAHIVSLDSFSCRVLFSSFRLSPHFSTASSLFYFFHSQRLSRTLHVLLLGEQTVAILRKALAGAYSRSSYWSADMGLALQVVGFVDEYGTIIRNAVFKPPKPTLPSLFLNCFCFLPLSPV